MKNLLKIEYLLLSIACLYVSLELGFAWYWYLLLFFLPDIGMLGYLINNKIGAISYNFFHHIGIWVAVYFIGIYFDFRFIAFIGILFVAHALFDRIFGYGLKYFSSFKDTHLGTLK